MVRFDREVCGCSKSDGCQKNFGCESENVRRKTKHKQHNDRATATSGGQIARDMDRTAQEIQDTYKQMMKALNRNSKIIKSIMRDLDNII